MNRRIFRTSMLALAVSGLITLYSPADSLEVIVTRIVLVVILALAIIPEDTP